MAISLDLNGGSSGANSSSSYAEQAVAATLFSASTISSPGTGRTVHSITLSIAGVPATESLSLLSVPAGLSVSWNQSAGVLTISATGADPADSVWQTALRSVTYSNSSDASATSRTIAVVARDDLGSSGSANGTVNVGAVNDAPVVDLNGAGSGTGATLEYTEGEGLTLITPSATVADVDSADFNGGSLRVSFAQNGTSADQLAIKVDAVVTLTGNTVRVDGTAIGTVSGGTNGSDLVVTFNSAATQARVTLLMEHIGYSNNSDNPSTAARSVRFAVNDGDGITNGGQSTSFAMATINASAVNDAPAANNVTANGAEDAASIAITLRGTDVDGTVTGFKVVGGLPSAAQGTLYTDAALTNAVTDGASCRASGSQLTLYFKPAPNFNGPVSFTYAALDNAGLADPTPATATVTVRSMNDPIVARNDTDSATTGNVTTGNVITGVDPDGPDAKLVLQADTQGDGPSIVRSITHDGITYTLNAAKSAVTVTGAPTPPQAHGPMLTLQAN